MSKRHFWKKNPIEKNPSFASLWRHKSWLAYDVIVYWWCTQESIQNLVWRHLYDVSIRKYPIKEKKWLDFFSKNDAGSFPGNRIFFKLTILGLKYVLWIFFPKMTLTDSPNWVWNFFPKMTLPHSPEKSPIFSFNLDIWLWWRQMYDVIACIGSLGDGVSI